MDGKFTCFSKLKSGKFPDFKALAAQVRWGVGEGCLGLGFARGFFFYFSFCLPDALGVACGLLFVVLSAVFPSLFSPLSSLNLTT